MRLLAATAVLAVIMAAIGTAACSVSGSSGASSTTTAPPQTTESAGPASTSSGTATTTAGAAAGQLQVHFIDVGQGDSTLIISPDGKVMLLDGGEADSGALDYLLANGIDHVDVLVATHPDKDHIGGLVDILHALPVAEVVTNGQSDDSKTYQGFLDAIADAQSIVVEAERGDHVQLGALTLAVLNPADPDIGDLDEDSLVLRLVYGKTAFLFAGDAGKKAEAAMLASGDELQAEVLKVGHHGSGSSTSDAFLAAVKPTMAVYSADGKSSDHPNKKTLARLADAGCQAYGTDINGTVIVTSDGATAQILP